MRPAESFIGQPIRSLQTMLRVLAAGGEKYPSVIPDGIYGRSTMQAVSVFQRRNGLPITGVTDQATWEAIVAAYEPALVEYAAAQPLLIVLEPGEVIRRGNKNPALPLIQGMLLTLSEVYRNISAPGLTGILDAPTASSLSSFQALSGLPVSGEVTRMTWKHLALQYPLAMNRHRKIYPQ